VQPLGNTSMWIAAETRPWRRSVCAPLVLEGGVRLRLGDSGLCYVRAKNLKWSNDDT